MKNSTFVQVIFTIKKLLFRILPQALYLKAMHIGFFILYDLGILKNDKRFKFHYAVKSFIKEGYTVIDIGANLGYFSKIFARKTTKGKLICIEPIPFFYSTLKNFLKPFPQVEIHNVALGNEEQIIEMVLPESNGVMRTGLPHIIGDGEQIGNQKTAHVSLKKGSELFKDLKRINYIKCDIEGYEWIVFQEIKKLIIQHRPIVQVEIAEESIPLFVDYFNELNYLQYGIKDFKLLRENGKQEEIGDFLFLPLEQQKDFESQFSIK